MFSWFQPKPKLEDSPQFERSSSSEDSTWYKWKDDPCLTTRFVKIKDLSWTTTDTKVETSEVALFGIFPLATITKETDVERKVPFIVYLIEGTPQMADVEQKIANDLRLGVPNAKVLSKKGPVRKLMGTLTPEQQTQELRIVPRVQKVNDLYAIRWRLAPSNLLDS